MPMFSLRNVIIALIFLTIGVAVYLFVLMPKPVSISEDLTPAPTSDLSTVKMQVVSETPEVTKSEVHSPNGDRNLIMEKTATDESITYKFYTDSIPAEEQVLIYEKTVSGGESFEISPNAWSPDNRYLFINEKTPEGNDYIVLRSDGDAIVDGEEFISVAPFFENKETGFEMNEVTGWASNTLLYITSKSAIGEEGPLFWFEVPAGSVIRLAGR